MYSKWLGSAIAKVNSNTKSYRVKIQVALGCCPVMPIAPEFRMTWQYGAGSGKI